MTHSCEIWLIHVRYDSGSVLTEGIHNPLSNFLFPRAKVRILQISGESWDIFHWYEWGPWNYVPCGTFTEKAGIATGKWIEKSFLVIVKFHKMSQMSHQMSHLRHLGKWIMDHEIFLLGLTLIHLTHSLTRLIHVRYDSFMRDMTH